MLEEKRKSCDLAVKDIDESKGIVQFYAASFGGEKDSDGDVIVKGAFKKTISENKSRFKHLYNHSKTIGVIQSIEENQKGLLVTSKLMQDDKGNFTTSAKDALIEYIAGGITEHSHGYKIIGENYDKEKDTNFITESKLWEVSSLDKWGANQHTPTVGVKSQRDCLESLKAIDKILHSTSISDEGAKNLLKLSEQINTYLKSLLKKEADSITSDSGVDYNFLNKNF